MSSEAVPTLIFFLTLEQQLPDFFFQAANLFNKHGVSLIPINIMELNEIKKGEQEVSVLVYTASLGQLVRFYKLRRRSLDMAIRNRKFRLFHVSSFSQIVELDRAKRMGVYYPYFLPQTTNILCEEISKELKRKEGKIEKWPGGRRAKLPFSSLHS